MAQPLPPHGLHCLVSLVAIGCASAPTPMTTTTRSSTQQADVAPTRFVSPYSYEWFIRAELLSARGQHAAAVEAYRMAMASADEDPYLYARLARELDLAGHAAAADEALAHGLSLDPESEAIWLARGEVAERRGDFAAALGAFERAEQAAPSSPDAPFSLARLLHAGGHDARAVQVLTRYAAREQSGEARAQADRLSLVLAQGASDELAEVARLWLARAPRQAALFRRLAHELRRAGNPYAALSLIRQLPDAKREELALLLDLGRFAAAELLLRETPPDRLGGPLAVAEAWLEAGHPARALEVLSEVPEGMEPHRRANVEGRALLAAGRIPQAALTLARIPRGSRYDAPARRALAQALQAGGLAALSREVEESPTQ